VIADDVAVWTSLRMLERYGRVSDAERKRAVRVVSNFAVCRDHSSDHTTILSGLNKLRKLLILNHVPSGNRERLHGEIPRDCRVSQGLARKRV
jgi:hypothetical protein